MVGVCQNWQAPNLDFLGMCLCVLKEQRQGKERDRPLHRNAAGGFLGSRDIFSGVAGPQIAKSALLYGAPVFALPVVYLALGAYGVFAKAAF